MELQSTTVFFSLVIIAASFGPESQLKKGFQKSFLYSIACNYKHK